MIQPEERAVLEALAEALLVLLDGGEVGPDGLADHESRLERARVNLLGALTRLRGIPKWPPECWCPMGSEGRLIPNRACPRHGDIPVAV